MTSWAPDPAEHGEDSVLVEHARDGDRVAFEALYRRHRDRVHGLVWRLAGGDFALAEDLLQEAFVRAWEKLGSFRGDSRFGTWLHRLSVNVALSDRRARMRSVGKETELTDWLEQRIAGEQNVRAPDQVDLERAIAGLPERARSVLVLHDIEGYSHAEVSELTGMAVGTSKAQLHRARRLLQEKLEK